MLYIVWIWWLFRSEEVAAILPSWHRALLGLQTHCSFAVMLHSCCEAKAPSVPQYRGVCCPLSCPACAPASRKNFLKGQCLRCFAGLFHTPRYSLGSLIWPALTQLCCQVWVSCLVWSLGQREELLHFRRGDIPSNQPVRPAAFLVLEVLPGSGNTIQSVTGGVFFPGGWKHKGVKRRPRTPCVRGAGLSQSG